MTGMFQSSSTASGISRLQASSAFSPSSASVIWKSSPSRILRATLRMTLESSTTRQVFILPSTVTQLRGPSRAIVVPASVGRQGRRSCRLPPSRHYQNLVDVEHHHEVTTEPMPAGRDLGHARVQIDGVLLAAVVGHLQHLA